MKKLITLVAILFFSFSIFSQDLPRKGSLGVVITITESGEGILMQKVLSGGTGHAIGIQDNDILLSVNGDAYNEVPALVALTRTWKEGNSVAVKLKRGKKIIKLKGNVVGKPKETSEHGKVIYGKVDYDGGMIRTILEIPTGVKNPPVMYFLPGIGCGSMDFYFDATDPIKQFVEGLVKKGIAVYRVEKPGMGDSQGTKDCLEMDYKYELEAHATALRHLKTISEIDSNNIFLYGHSLGGLTAPLIAEEEQVKGIIAWGSVSTSWYEYYLKLLRDQKILQNEEYEEIEKEYRANQPFIYDFYVNQKSPDELEQVESYQELMTHYFPRKDLYLGMHHYKYVQQLNQVNLTKAWKNVNCDVMALHGEFDLHAVDSDWAKNVADLVNYYQPGKGNWKVVPNVNHHFVFMPSWEEYNRVRNEGINNAQYRGKNFNPSVIDEVGGFIMKVLQRA